MRREPLRQRPVALAAVAGMGLAYAAMVRLCGTLTGHPMTDGVIGVLLGLWIASFPAANSVDLLFYRSLVHRRLEGWRGVAWVGLNLVVFFAAFLAIDMGASALAMPAVR